MGVSTVIHEHGARIDYAIDAEGNATVVRYTTEEAEARVPGELEGHRVVAIGAEAFASSVAVAPGLSIVGAGAFDPKRPGPRGLPSAHVSFADANRRLERVVLPEGVMAIGRAAFRGCGMLSEISLPSTLERIDDLAFSMTRVRSIVLPSGIKVLSPNALRTGPEVLPGHDASYRSTIDRVELHSGNGPFRMVGSVLCRKLGGAGLLEAVFCPGNADIVDLTVDKVASIRPEAFQGTYRLGELVIDELIEYDASIGLLPNGACGRLTVGLREPWRRYDRVSVRIPGALQGKRLFDTTRGSGAVDVRAFLSAYDAAALEMEDRLEQSKVMLERLSVPIMLGTEVRRLFDDALAGSFDSLCVHFGARGMWDRYDMMADAGILDSDNVLRAVDALGRVGDTASVAYVLQLGHIRGWDADGAPGHSHAGLPASSQAVTAEREPVAVAAPLPGAGGERDAARPDRARLTDGLASARTETVLDAASGLAAEIIDDARSKLMLSLRFMDTALWRMPIATKRIRRSVATDGYLFYMDPVAVVRSYRGSAAEIVRDYLHGILHCVFRHPFDDRHPDEPLWDLACDIAVEACALELVGMRFPSKLDSDRRKALAKLRDACPQLTAAKIYAVLRGAPEEGDVVRGIPAGRRLSTRFLGDLPPLFSRDDHTVWTRSPERPAAQMTFDDDVSIVGASDERLSGERATESQDDDRSGPKPGMNMPGAAAPSAGGSAVEGDVEGGDRFLDVQALEQGEESFASMHGVRIDDFDSITWTDISKLVEIEMEAFTGKPGIDSGSFEVNLHVANRKACDFGTFLKRFSALSEEMKVSTEEFDYVYYTYGLSHYGNMPLVEPLEYQETRRIRDFVIAIDTSASCAGGLVRHFIEKSYDVLRNSAAFGHKVNVHVVQCDCDVRKDTVITSVRDLDGDFGDFVARGFGGTDFRPVFKHVDDLRSSRGLVNLKGMIYLTDGVGKYPEEAPDYECVFVFVNEDGRGRKVPPWATKVLMTEDEILEL